MVVAAEIARRFALINSKSYHLVWLKRTEPFHWRRQLQSGLFLQCNGAALSSTAWDGTHKLLSVGRELEAQVPQTYLNAASDLCRLRPSELFIQVPSLWVFRCVQSLCQCAMWCLRCPSSCRLLSTALYPWCICVPPGDLRSCTWSWNRFAQCVQTRDGAFAHFESFANSISNHSPNCKTSICGFKRPSPKWALRCTCFAPFRTF